LGDRIVSTGLRRASGGSLRALVAGAALLSLCAAALAEVTVTVHQRDHLVSGTSAAGLVRSMNGNPVRGDHGNAYASIHPNFNLSVSTRERGGICRADVRIRLSFQLTLPKAASPGAMSSRTRSAWNGFANFAKRHEAWHQSSYTGCAKSFVAKAERMSDRQCHALQSDIRQAFNQMRRDCETKQLSYDRSQARVLAGLALFSMARAERRARR
jgi:predicted secreted Zn-dependent protease